MAKVRNELEQKAYDLLQRIPAVRCVTVETRPFYNDGRTAKIPVCEINGEPWVPVAKLSYGSSRLNQTGTVMKAVGLTDGDYLPLRSPNTVLWFIRTGAVEQNQEALEKILKTDISIQCLRAVLTTLSEKPVKVLESYAFSTDDIAAIHRNYAERIRLIEENHRQQRIEFEQKWMGNGHVKEHGPAPRITKEEVEEAYLKKLLTATDDEIHETMSAMESIDELAGRIISLCLDWVKHTGDRGGDWGNGLVMGLSKATSYLLIGLDRQGERKTGDEKSIIDYYQAMLPLCLEIAKEEIKQKEAEERERKMKEGAN